MRSLAALLLVFILIGDAAAQRTSRIRFARGAVRADVSSTLRSYRGERIFLIRVRDGQTIRTEQIGGGRHPITIYITDPTGQGVGDSDASCNNRREITPTVAGDYIIKVVECRKADPWRGSFRFRVTVR